MGGMSSEEEEEEEVSPMLLPPPALEEAAGLWVSMLAGRTKRSSVCLKGGSRALRFPESNRAD